jgi:hypothetical protein
MTIQINDPLMDRSMSGWIHNTARQNYWRVARWYDLSDLIQDGYLAYAKCRSRYGHIFGNPPTNEERRWFMSLVQRIYCNRIYDLSIERPRTNELEDAWLSEGDEQAFAGAPDCGIASDVEIGGVLSSLPSELRQLVTALASDVSAGYRRSRLRTTETAKGSVRVQRGRKALRETRNEFFCRLIGLDPAQTNLAQQLSDYLSLTWRMIRIWTCGPSKMEV